MDTATWSDHLCSIAAPALVGTPLHPTEPAEADPRAFIAAFTDELGHRRAVDQPILGRMLGLNLSDDAPADPASPDAALWWALHTRRPIEELIAPSDDPEPAPVIGLAPFREQAIEIATETELSALHALSHHAARDDRWRRRCLGAARWHIDVLQPDNGTNHPWAIHVFLALADADPALSHEARLHAESLLHNALVSSGRPDRFSACLLLDASRAARPGHSG